MATAKDDGQAPHALSLKVMRLTRPTLATHVPVYYEKTETAHASSVVEGLETLTIMDLHTTTSMEQQPMSLAIRDFGLSHVLTLPSSFGNIYLGESFTTLVSVNNESMTAVTDVHVDIKLQTSSQRLHLDETSSARLAAGQTHNGRVSHEIKELGVHILVCEVRYQTAEGQRQFRQFYKFQVTNPLAVKTKVNNVATGRVFLEVQLQNVSAGPMFLERMHFEPSEHFVAEDVNHDEDKNSIFGDALIHPQDIRQYLYQLDPRSTSTERLARTTNALGKLDIVWRTSMGDTGRLQTSQLTRKVPLVEDMEAHAVKCSTDKVVLEKPFTLTVRITNNSPQSMKLVLSAVKTKMGSVLLSGQSSKPVGDLPAYQSTTVPVEFFPLTPGLQRVGGLRVLDLLTGSTKDIDHLCDVFVLSTS